MCLPAHRQVTKGKSLTNWYYALLPWSPLKVPKEKFTGIKYFNQTVASSTPVKETGHRAKGEEIMLCSPSTFTTEEIKGTALDALESTAQLLTLLVLLIYFPVQ